MKIIAIHREGLPTIERIVEVPLLECPLDDEVRKALSLPKSYPDDQCSDGESWVEVSGDVDGETHYIDLDQRVAVARSAFNPEYSINGLVVRFDWLPGGTVIGAMRQTMKSDGDDEIEFDVPGTYRIGLHHPHYRDEVMEVTVG